MPVSGAALLLAAGHYQGTFANRLLSARPMLFFGKISYSLYLVHWPIIMAIGYGGARIGGSAGWLAFLASVILAWLSFRFIETPVRTRQWFARRSVLFAFCGAGTVLFAGLGTLLYMTGGLPQRFADQARMAQLTELGRWSDPRGHCYNLKPGDISAGRFCIRGREGAAPTLALIGDSHAQGLAPGLFAAADRAAVAGAQFTSMGYMPPPGRSPLGQDFEPKLDPELFRWLDENPQVKVTFVSGFWLYEVTGKTYRHKGVIQIDDQYDGSGLAYNPTSFARGIERLLARFPGRKFVTLDDIPTGRGLDPKHYLRGLTGRGVGQAEIKRAQAEEERAAYAPLLRNLSARHPNLVFEEVLFEAHCNDRSFALFGPDGNQRFVDGDHITYQRSLELTGPLYAMLRRNLSL